VLLVSRAADRELDLVGRLLGAAGVPVVRLDAETAARCHLVVDLHRAAVRVDGRWITPTVTWVRHFSARAMPASRGAARRIFAGQSWQELAGQLGAVSAVPLTSRGPGLLDQLAAARSHGIAVPRTVVTTDLDAAHHLLGSSQVVIKALHQHFAEARPGLLTGIFPEITGRDTLAGHQAGGGPPVVVQEYVDHDLEVRAYYAGGQVTAFAVGKAGPAQPWLQPEQVTAAQIEPPPAIAIAVRSLAAAMSLEYGAFDFLSAKGVPVFLEVSPSGDWRWLEKKAGSAPVTTAVTRMLAELHRSALGTTRPGRQAGIDPVRLLTGGLPADPG
jgi:hypothetical protein